MVRARFVRMTFAHPGTAARPMAISYRFEGPPEPGVLTAVARGVFWLRQPLPFALDHVNLWLLEDGDGWTVVDTGLATDDSREIWETVFASYCRDRPITRIVVTHFHPDHVGLAGWLTERWRAPLLMTRSEWLTARLFALDSGPEMIERQIAFYRRAGCDHDYLEAIERRGPAYVKLVSGIPPAFAPIHQDDCLEIGGRRWRVLVGRGHAPEQACLFTDDGPLLISADQVLPRISPNVAVQMSEPEAEPLGRFLDSLRRFAELPASTLVLPSHGIPFEGLHPRIEALLRHHEERLKRLEAALGEPLSAMEAARVLFDRPLDVHQTGFAVGETLAHLHHLMAAGKVRRTAGGDGVDRYRTLGSSAAGV